MWDSMRAAAGLGDITERRSSVPTVLGATAFTRTRSVQTLRRVTTIIRTAAFEAS